MIDDRTPHDLAMRFAAERLCLWCLCSRKACRRTRACIGETRSCTRLIADWVDALHAERRERPDLDAVERDLATMGEVRAFRAWRLELDRAFMRQRKDPEDDRLREELARMTENLSKRLAQEREEAARREREAAERQEVRKPYPPSCPDLFRASNSDSPLDCRDKPGNDEKWIEGEEGKRN